MKTRGSSKRARTVQNALDMAQGVPASQPKPWRDGEGEESLSEEPDDGEDLEEDEVSDERVAAAWGRTRPKRTPGGAMEREHRRRKREREDVQDDEALGEADDPELAEFFGDIPPAQQISICRAYASYLAAAHRGKLASSRAGAAYPRRQSKG